MQDSIAEFYSKSQLGGSLPAYVGSRRTLAGGGLLGTLARFAMPLLRSLGSRVLNVASRTADDVLESGRPFRQSLLNNTMDEVRSAIKRPAHSINKEGEGADDIFSSKRARRHLR